MGEKCSIQAVGFPAAATTSFGDKGAFCDLAKKYQGIQQLVFNMLDQLTSPYPFTDGLDLSPSIKPTSGYQDLVYRPPVTTAFDTKLTRT